LLFQTGGASSSKLIQGVERNPRKRVGSPTPASSDERKLMSILQTNPIVFFWRWIRYKVMKWQMKNVDPMYPDMIKYVKDKNEFESTYGTGW
jgi:hypothetical protein